MTSDNATSICNFSVGETLRAFLISSINCSRSADLRDVSVVSYLDSLPTLDPFSSFRYGDRALAQLEPCEWLIYRTRTDHGPLFAGWYA